jgi:hypothetical protein
VELVTELIDPETPREHESRGPRAVGKD